MWPAKASSVALVTKARFVQNRTPTPLQVAANFGDDHGEDQPMSNDSEEGGGRTD